MKINVNVLNAFPKTTNGGNPAGVVLKSNCLSENQMQSVAKQMGLSETAFVQNSSIADYKIQFYTPVSEVDLCGHATIASFALLFENRSISKGVYTLETKAGVLDIEVQNDSTVFMTQKLPEFLQVIDKDEIAESLGISRECTSDTLPIQIVSTGLNDILVPVKNLNVLNNVIPDYKKISEVSEKYNAVGYHVFTLESQSSKIAFCRNFAPLYEIDEEAATGTATGALSCYLYKYDIINGGPVIDNLNFAQGYSMEKPSEIQAKLIIENDEIKEVWVGGKAKRVSIRELTVT